MKYALYYHDYCPFCQRVLMTLTSFRVKVEKRNVMENPEFRKQQQAATGRTTVPCLLIENGDSQEWMYESSDIIAYLKGL